MVKRTLKGHSKAVVIAWNEFIKDPANKLPMVADAISHLDKYIKQQELEEQNKNQLKLF